MAEPAPDTTVCVVSWNAAADLEACLASLAGGADSLRLQTVVVDNGSTDATAAVLERFPAVEVIRNERNLGLTPGRNQALALARGRQILMLDADTVALPGSIAVLSRYLDDHPEVGLAGAMLLNGDGSLQLSCRTVPPAILPFLRRPPLARWFEHSATVDSHLMRDFDHAVARPVDWVLGACQCYRAEIAAELGGYDERIFSHGGEDTDWCLRVWKAGHEVHYVPSAQMVHRYGHFTRKRPFSKQSVRAFVDFYYGIWKHRDVRHGVAER